jgi:hypothetical protein
MRPMKRLDIDGHSRGVNAYEDRLRRRGGRLVRLANDLPEGFVVGLQRKERPTAEDGHLMIQSPSPTEWLGDQ